MFITAARHPILHLAKNGDVYLTTPGIILVIGFIALFWALAHEINKMGS